MRKVLIGLLLVHLSLSVVLAQDLITDTLQGRGVRGPYWLGWEQIVEKSETIFVEGRWLVRGKDYWLDYAAGKIAFAEPLRQGRLARITYQIQPGVSRPNQKRSEIPLQIGLAHFGRGELGVMGKFFQTDSADGGTLGIYGRWQGDSAHAESLYLLQNPSNKAPALLRATGGWASTNGLRSSFLYTRADPAFAEAKAYGALPGKEITQVGLEWAANPQLNTRLQWQNWANLNTPSETGQNWLAAVAYRQPRWGMSTERSIQLQANKPNVQTDRLKLETTPFKTVQMKIERTDTFTEGVDPTRQTVITLGTGASPTGFQITHQIGQTGEQVNTQTQIGFQAQTTRGSGRVSLLEQNAPDVVNRAAQLQLTGQLTPTLQVGGEYRVQEQAGQMRGYEVRMRPVPNLQMRLRQKEFEGLGGLWTDSRQVEWAWQPFTAINLSGSYAERPEDQQGQLQPVHQQSHQATLTLGGWRLQAGYTEARALAQPGIDRTYLVGVQRTLDPATLLFLSYQQTDSLRDVLLRQGTLKLGFTRRLGWFDFSIEAAATMPYLEDHWDPRATQYSGSAKLGVRF